MERYQLPNYSINLREAPIKKECGTNPVQRIRFKASKKQRTSDLSYWNYPEEAMVKASALKSYGFYIHIYKDFVLSLWAENPRADTDLSNKKTFFFNLEKNNNLNLDMFRVGSTRPKYLLKNMHTEESYRFTRFTINERFRWKTTNVRILFILIFSCVRSHCSYHEPSPLPLLVHR